MVPNPVPTEPPRPAAAKLELEPAFDPGALPEATRALLRAEARFGPRGAPFRRTGLCRFGLEGTRPLVPVGPAEKAYWRLLTAVLLVPRTVLFVSTLLLLGALWTLAALALPRARAAAVVRITGKAGSRVLLFAAGFLWMDVARSADRGAFAPVVVSNHSSWADILIMCVLYMPGFVAKADVQKVPIIGFLADCMECLYVQRRGDRGAPSNFLGKAPSADPLVPPDSPKRGEAGPPAQRRRAGGGAGGGGPEPDEAAAGGGGRGSGTGDLVKRRLERAAADGGRTMSPLCVFPEGTTSNNVYLMPFRRGFALGGTAVRPVVIKYGTDPTRRVSPSYETLSGKQHLLLMLRSPYHTVRVEELPVMTPSAAEKADPALFAERVRSRIAEAGGFVKHASSLADKRDYQKALRDALKKVASSETK